MGTISEKQSKDEELHNYPFDAEGYKQFIETDQYL